MSQSEEKSGFGPGRATHDPLTGGLLAMQQAWLAALGVQGQPNAAGSRPGAATPGEALVAPMMGMLGAMADLAGATRQRFDNSGAGPGAGSPSDGQPGSAANDFLVPIGHAMAIAANRSISYWTELARIVGNHRSELVQAVGLGITNRNDAPGSDRLVAVDELRAVLREVGELAVREAQTLQQELSRLDDTLTQNFQQPDQPGPYRRRWRTKA